MTFAPVKGVARLGVLRKQRLEPLHALAFRFLDLPEILSKEFGGNLAHGAILCESLYLHLCDEFRF
jgi:hypothetical protein